MTYQRLIIISSIISLCLTGLALLWSSPINIDGTLYLQVAQTFQQQGFAACMAIYHWPLLAILIAFTNQVTQLSLISSAQLLNGLLQMLLVIGFIRLCRALGAEGKTLVWAAVVILIFPYLNSVRALIVRDFGYWALSIWAIAHLCEYVRYQRSLSAWLWSSCMLLATLFRIEGGLLLLLLPLPLLMFNNPLAQRLKQFLHAYGLVVIGLILLGSYLGFHHSQGHIDKLGRITELSQQLHHGWSMAIHTLQQTSQAMAQTALAANPFSQANASTVLAGGIIAIFIVALVQVLGWFNLLILIYPRSNLSLTKPNIIVLWAIILNILLLLAYAAQMLFIDKRYIVLLALLLLTQVPVNLQHLYQKWQAYPLRLWLLSLCLIIVSLSGIIRFGYSKAYLIDAGAYLKPMLLPSTTLYSNSREVLFYANYLDSHWDEITHQVDLTQLLQQSAWRHYDYLAIAIKRREADALQPLLKPLGEPVRVFSNERHDQVLIFKTK